MKRYCSLILILVLLLFSLTACRNKSDAAPNPDVSSGNTQTDISGDSSDDNTVSPGPTSPFTDDSSSGNNNSDSTDTRNEDNALPEVTFSSTASDMFTKRDRKTEYDDTAVLIQLNVSSATATSDKVQISDNNITISEEDTYVLSGTLDDGTIVVDADDSAKIHLIFDGININSNDSAALLILSADKVTVTLVSENVLSNSGYFAPADTLNINAALYSKEDLSLNGSGSLTVSSPAGHGISCKDDLVLAGGTYTVTAANHGLDANDSIRLTASTLSIEAGKDGIHAENADDTSLGFVYIADGTYNINANDDGISAGAYLQIEDGTFNITTTAAASSADASGKGLKSTNSMQISSGSFTVSSYDDSIHSNTDIIINGGTYQLTSQDDGIHADASLTVNDGDINITKSYEGLEALDLTVNGGNIRLIASDDGLNAAGGNDGSGFGGRGNDNFGGRGGADGFNGNLPEDFEDWFNGGQSGDTSDGNWFSDWFNGGQSDNNPVQNPFDGSGINQTGFRSTSSSDGRAGGRGQSPQDKGNMNMPNMPEGGFGGGNFGGGDFGGGNFGGGGFPGGMGNSDGSVTISGGTLYIQASGDGIDANGSLTITGGDITICGPNRGDTASLDYDLTGTISGATFIATGASGMAQTLSSSEQGIITANVGTQNAGTTITLTDSKGNVLLTQTPELAYSLIIFSSPDLVSGKSYTLTYGTTTKTITAD